MPSADRMPTARFRGSPFAAGFASVAGWSFDLFDLFIVLYVAGAVGKQIFPSSRPTLSLAAVFASFAVSVLLRPLGAAIFGQYADRHGRKRTLVIVLTGVGVSTSLMGLVPTYGAVGLLAPALFVMLRVVQGVFVGGVVASTHTLGTESVAPHRRGLMSGLVGGGGSAIGAAMASVLFLGVSAAFPGDAFYVWGWRVMFFSGLLAALLSFVTFVSVEESPAWREAADRSGPRIPLRALVARGERGRFAVNLAVASGAGGMYYLTAGYLPTFVEKVNGLGPTPKGGLLLASSLIVLISAPLAGMASQRFGRRRTMLVLGAVNIVVAPLLLWRMSRLGADDLGALTLTAMALTFIAGGCHAPVIAYLNERYPTALRSRGTALCWNIGFMIGGLLPTFVSLASPGLRDIPSRLIGFVIGALVVYLGANLLSPETRQVTTADASRQDPGKSSDDPITYAEPSAEPTA
jgi:MHS family proline/betaine transporter-like MFS transporter